MYDKIVMKNQSAPSINFTQTKKITKASLKVSSPYPTIRASFNWLNVDFPYPHTHTHWEIFIILKGKLKHTINGVQEIGSKGYACIIRPNDYHYLEYVDNDRDTQHINITFSNEMANCLFSYYHEFALDLEDEKPLHFFLESSFIDSIIKQALIAQSSPKKLYEQHSILLLHQLINVYFYQKINSNEAYPNWLNSFLNFLHSPECFSLSANELALHTPYSYSRLARLFKQYIGQTLIEYLNNLKIVYAKRLLRITSKSILDISIDLGYDSVSSFNHNFKSITALTPTQYRKKYTANLKD